MVAATPLQCVDIVATENADGYGRSPATMARYEFPFRLSGYDKFPIHPLLYPDEFREADVPHEDM